MLLLLSCCKVDAVPMACFDDVLFEDCCHSGTMLDHNEIQITGNKNGAADSLPVLANLGAIAGLFGVKNMPGEIRVAQVGEQGDFKNRYVQLLAWCVKSTRRTHWHCTVIIVL